MAPVVPVGTRITDKGRELAKKLWPLIGITPLTSRTCSLIARHATTHHWLMEVDCNRGLLPEETRKVDQIEKRIADLVEFLPESDLGPFEVEFQGDPRGVTVKLRIKGVSRHHTYDGWANEAIMVPQ